MSGTRIATVVIDLRNAATLAEGGTRYIEFNRKVESTICKAGNGTKRWEEIPFGIFHVYYTHPKLMIGGCRFPSGARGHSKSALREHAQGSIKGTPEVAKGRAA